MSRLILVLAALAAFAVASGAPAEAQNPCRNEPHGKCPAQTPHAVPKKAPAKAKPSFSREQFTPAQRAILLEKARELCKKEYGAEATVYHLDYAKMVVTCTNNTR